MYALRVEHLTLRSDRIVTVLALSHARSGDTALIGGSRARAIEKAIAAFSAPYADQNEKDHAAMKRAIREGKVKAVFE